MAWILSSFADEASEHIDQQIEAMAQAKIDHVDPRLVDGINIVELPLDHAEKVQAKLETAGIGVGMYGSPIGKIDMADDFNIDRARLEHLAKLRDIFGSNRVRIFSYFNDKGAVDADGWRDGSVQRLNELSELADKLDMVLYHENELNIFGDVLENVCVLRDQVHHQHPDRFKLIFDFDNYNQCDNDIWANWLELRDSTEAIHLKESKRQDDGTYQHVPAGQGDGRIPEILADLAARGWEGPLTLEPHLARSEAVLATGPHGQANQSLADLNPTELFCVAAQAARGLLGDLGKLA